MFDNDFDNNTNPDDCHSRMIEVTLNQTSMTAYVNWSWEAPIQYWNYYAGANLLLPNGDFLGDFGDPSHQQPQNSINGQDQSWSFNDTGAVFVEVNPAGQIVKTFTFPVGCYVYRVTTIANPTSGNFPTPTPTSTPTSTATSTATSTSTSTPTSSPVTQIPPITTQNPTQNPATSTPLATATPTLATTSPPITTPTPSILPSSTPNGSISSQIIIMGTALAAVIVVAVILAFVFFIRKRTPNQNNPSPKH
jgi:hypothetical protein